MARRRENSFPSCGSIFTLEIATDLPEEKGKKSEADILTLGPVCFPKEGREALSFYVVSSMFCLPKHTLD